jgi:putative membrane protein
MVADMKALAQSFLNQEEQQRITQCVHEAEKKTSGEIVPMVMSSSHDYPLASLTGASFIALPVSLLLTRLLGGLFWLGPDSMWLFLALFCALFTGAHLLISRLAPLKRLFLSPQRVEEEVKEAATTAFFTEELYRTKAENGILLYISVFERRVWVLADRGINDKIPQQQWQGIVDLVTAGIRDHRQCEAICEAIEQIGDILADFFPIEADDKDELHNLIIR